MAIKLPIAISISPNTESDDVWRALSVMLTPWSWKNGESLKTVTDMFKKLLNVDRVYLFNSGRSALFAVLKSFDIGKDCEVLLQAFTCVAVPEAILWVGAKPIFVDIDESLNIDPKLLVSHINRKTKAIIVQHTFGIPAKINMIKKIAQKYNLVLIEDCAHSLGVKVNNKYTGTLGDASIFSFGRDKVISSVFGGMAVISSKFKVQSSKLKKIHENLPFPSYFWILQQLFHPVAFFFIMPFYNLAIGKLAIIILQKLKLLSKPVYKEELTGVKPTVFPQKYPNALAFLLIGQLAKLDTYNRKRMQMANYYCRAFKNLRGIMLPKINDNAIYLRFNILIEKAEKIRLLAKNKGIFLGNWYHNVIDPKGVKLGKIGYKKGMCPKSERLAKMSVNLPTYPRLSFSEADKVISIISHYAH